MHNIVIEAILKKENSITALINYNNKFKELNFIKEEEIFPMIRFLNSNSTLINKHNIFNSTKDYKKFYDNIVNKLERSEILQSEFIKLCDYIKENGKNIGFTYVLDDCEFIDWGKDKEGKYPKTIIFPNNIRLDEYEDGSLTYEKNNKDIFPILEKYLKIIDNKLFREIN